MNPGIYEILTNILISGTIVTMVSYISIYSNPLIASIIWSFPISFFSMAYVMHSKKQTNKQIAKLFLNIVLLIFPLFIVTLGFYKFLCCSKNNDVYTPIIKTIMLWAAISILYYGIIYSTNMNTYLE